MKYFLILLSLLLTGCEYLTENIKAKPAPDAGFVSHPEQMSPHYERFPFNRIWCEADKCDWTDYKSVYIADVDTNHLLKMSWWDKFNLESKAEQQKERHIIADYMKQSFEDAFRNDPNKLHTVVDQPDDNTMILELALVELVPTKAFLHTAADVLGFIRRGASLLDIPATGRVSIEGRLRDAKSGEVFFKFADRENDQSTPVSIADYTWHWHAKDIIDEWAGQMVELSDTHPSHKVEASSVFTLKPW